MINSMDSSGLRSIPGGIQGAKSPVGSAPLKYERKIQSEFRENFSSIDIERQKHQIIPPTFFESTDFVWVN